MNPVSARYLKGAACGLAAASIWASQSAVTRFAVTTSFDPWDVALLRFGVAGLLLAPVAARRGLSLDRLGWLGLAMLIAGAGAPYVLVAARALRLAPAAELSALNPGCIPLFVAALAFAFARETVSAAQRAGLALIVAGAALLIAANATDADLSSTTSRLFGAALALLAALMWAVFTLVMRRADLDPLHAAALVSTGSLVIYLPVYAAWRGTALAQVPLVALTTQVVFQGVLVTIVSLLLYGRAVAVLGAAGGAAFGALVPALTALIAIPLLGEWPRTSDWLAIVVIGAGVYLTSGGPIARKMD
ncbi:MAG TPA: DMT family transporter [Xanthobacteraceae bacterium]|jgi:drug/metabolite transporter (DMT)-like permease|nr:DMT family transporter [Xanthobacteraceae bacterium]